MKSITPIILLLAVSASPAAAQIIYEGCTDPFGNPVPSIQATHIPDVAIATMHNGGPAIFYNPFVLQNLPPIVRRFFYAHECAHHQLGHILTGQNNMIAEQAADCWAAHAVQRTGATTFEMNVIAQTLAGFGPGDWTHLPGPRRAINLGACLQQPPPAPPPPAHACCDTIGMRRCSLMQPLLTGMKCMCPGQGLGQACP